MIEVEGAKVEVLAWGQRGKPGLMFLHGGAAHADWWSFIAPFFAAQAASCRSDLHRHGTLRLAGRL